MNDNEISMNSVGLELVDAAANFRLKASAFAQAEREYEAARDRLDRANKAARGLISEIESWIEKAAQ